MCWDVLAADMQKRQAGTDEQMRWTIWKRGGLKGDNT